MAKYEKLELVDPPSHDPISITPYSRSLAARWGTGQKVWNYRVAVQPTLTDEGRNKDDTPLFTKVAKVSIKGDQEDHSVYSNQFVTQAATGKGTVAQIRTLTAASDTDGDDDPRASTNRSIVRRGRGKPDVSINSLELLLYHSPRQRVVTGNKGPFNSPVFKSIMLEWEILGENSSDDLQKLLYIGDKYLAEVEATVGRTWMNDYKVAILLKMVGVAIYRNKFYEAMRLVDRALALLPHTSCADHMEGRLSFYVSAIHREKKEYDKAKDWLDRGQQKLGMLEPCEDTAKGYFNVGKLYMRLLSDQERLSSDAINAMKRRSIDNFLWAIEHFKQQPEEDKKQIKRCLLNIASVVVQSPRCTHGRDRRVSVEDLELAGRVIRHLNSEAMEDGIKTVRSLVQVFGSESEVLYREACLQLEKCKSYDRERPLAEHRCLCSSEGDCEYTKEAMTLFRQSMSKLQLLTKLSRRHGFKEAEQFADFIDHIGVILSRQTRPLDPILQGAVQLNTHTGTGSTS